MTLAIDPGIERLAVLKGALGGTADVQSPSPVAVGTLSELHAQRMQRPLVLKEEIAKPCVCKVCRQQQHDAKNPELPSQCVRRVLPGVGNEEGLFFTCTGTSLVQRGQKPALWAAECDLYSSG